MSYQVELKEIKDIKVMSIRITTSLKKIVNDIPTAYGQLYAHSFKHGYEFTEDCFNLYHCKDFNPDLIDVECCVGVYDYVLERDVFKSRLVEGGFCACLVHKGLYKDLERSYIVLENWIRDNEYEVCGIIRESYLNMPEDPEDALIEIVWPVVKV